MNPNSEYTGCRGTIADGTANSELPADVTVLGHEVAIDGENGMSRPFLLADLERLRAMPVRSRATSVRTLESESGSSSD
jgi:hypothetical protein